MGKRELRIPLTSTIEDEALGRLTEALTGHFARIACDDHRRCLEIEFERTPSHVVGTLQACCPSIRAQAAIHEACAEELAAIHGMELAWGRAA